ncbi:unnamed protein product [Rotaria sp. Silwood1]|nr:unnamed protein product [Rotaria sp. Silwood1]CAF1626360.1 unnamed protein product [Rotaria sp. Silwood1]CAF3720973.1 unnamed protein product [Rotaria sp. Silwood1]
MISTGAHDIQCNNYSFDNDNNIFTGEGFIEPTLNNHLCPSTLEELTSSIFGDDPYPYPFEFNLNEDQNLSTYCDTYLCPYNENNGDVNSNTIALNSLHNNNIFEDRDIIPPSANNHENLSYAPPSTNFSQDNHQVHHTTEDQKIARKFRFDLIGNKTFEKRLLNNDRMSKQMYAITCYTDIRKEYVMREICRQFSLDIIQYACVSVDHSPTTTEYFTMYIQILLKRNKNKFGWFLDKITGDKCNYHVTNKELAWNEFIKKGK